MIFLIYISMFFYYIYIFFLVHFGPNVDKNLYLSPATLTGNDLVLYVTSSNVESNCFRDARISRCNKNSSHDPEKGGGLKALTCRARRCMNSDSDCFFLLFLIFLATVVI